MHVQGRYFSCTVINDGALAHTVCREQTLHTGKPVVVRFWASKPKLLVTWHFCENANYDMSLIFCLGQSNNW